VRGGEPYRFGRVLTVRTPRKKSDRKYGQLIKNFNDISYG
jgi:hypothetical protein